MNIVKKSINYAKAIAAETISNAESGHTGVALGASTILFTLFKDFMNFDISDAKFINRDRLVLSAGHASALYYTILSMFGFDVSLQDLKEFRKFGSHTPGHPERSITDGVEVSTGPLGQGVANAVGLAIAESILEERFNAVGMPIINNYTYCFAGDGCLMEGVSEEAISLAGNLNLNRLIVLYDNNDVTIDGSLALAKTENIAKKFKAMKWNVIKVINGNSYYSVKRAISRARKSSKPTLIMFKTTIGLGTEKEGTSSIHGIPLKKDELLLLKEKLKVKESFYIPSDVRDFCMTSARRGKLNHEEWNKTVALFETTHPDLYKQFESFFDRSKLDFEKILKNYTKWENLSGRAVNGIILNEISDKIMSLIGGTADLAPSTKCYINNGANYSAGNRRGRNIHYGVREHAMGAITNGLALYADFIPFDSTFLAFSNYMIPPIRMAALMNLQTLHMFTHDSIVVGEDGPSHQPIEQITQLRSIVNNYVYRPCDGKELLACYKNAFEIKAPSCFILSRQNLPLLEDSSYQDALNGAYIISACKQSVDIVIIATGSEVTLALDVKKELSKKYDITVVSMPCIEIFDKQSQAYKNKIIDTNAKLRVAIEASNDNIFYRFLDRDDLFIGVDSYQKSGKGEEVYKNAGFSVKNIVRLITSKLK